MFSIRLLSATVVSSFLLFAASPAADADHANTRRWKQTSGDITQVTVVDRTGSAAWNTATQKAVQDWNAANTTLRLSWTSGTGACNYEAHRINVCMAYANGYDGYASWRYDGTGYLSGATVSFDPNRTSNYNTFARNYLACHEIGHNLVLNHSSNSDSCMSPYAVDRPGAHDIEALRSTYGTWTGTTATTTTTIATTPTTTATTTTTTPTKCRSRRCR